MIEIRRDGDVTFLGNSFCYFFDMVVEAKSFHKNHNSRIRPFFLRTRLLGFHLSVQSIELQYGTRDVHKRLLKNFLGGKFFLSDSFLPVHLVALMHEKSAMGP